MELHFIFPSVQAPLRWGFSRIGLHCPDELNYIVPPRLSQPFPQQNQRKMPSEGLSDGDKKTAKFAAWREFHYCLSGFRRHEKKPEKSGFCAENAYVL